MDWMKSNTLGHFPHLLLSKDRNVKTAKMGISFVNELEICGIKSICLRDKKRGRIVAPFKRLFLSNSEVRLFSSVLCLERQSVYHSSF